jgi:hypothetical protein
MRSISSRVQSVMSRLCWRGVQARAKADLDIISHCADRYRVSLIAALLRWPEYTERRAVLVVSRDGFILWGRSSKGR